MDMAKRKDPDLETYRKALKNLVEACEHVQLLTGKVSAETVVDVRKCLKLLSAHDAARELLGMD